MNNGVRITESDAKRLIGLDTANLLAVNGIVHNHVVGIHRTGAGTLTHAQGIKGMKCIRT